MALKRHKLTTKRHKTIRCYTTGPHKNIQIKKKKRHHIGHKETTIKTDTISDRTQLQKDAEELHTDRITTTVQNNYKEI